MKRASPGTAELEARREAGAPASRRSSVGTLATLLLLSLTSAGCGTKAGEWLGLGEKALFDLQSEDAGLAITTSSNPAAKLGFVCVPRTISAGSPFSWSDCSSLQVQILDSGNARVVGAYSTGNDSALTVSLSVVSGTGSLQTDQDAQGFTVAENGTVSVAADAGLASFADAGLNLTAAGFKIIRATVTTSSGKILSVSSPRFTVLPKDQIGSIVFVAQPQSSYLSGIGWSKVPTVEIRDEYGNRITTGTQSTTAVSFAIADEPGMLLGTTTVSARAGLVSPRAGSMNILTLGSGLVLRATATSGQQSLTVDSNAFSIVHGPATQLVFTQQPTGASADDELGTKPIVEIRDRFGNRVTTGADASAKVVLSASPRLGTLVGSNVVSGSITMTASEGRIDFSEESLSLRQVGTNRRLQAAALFSGARRTTTAQSSVFTITAGEVSPLTSSLTVSNNARAIANGLAFLTVTFIARDAWENPVSGYPSSGFVEFAATGTGNLWTQPSVATDSKGRAVGRLRATYFGPRTITVASPEALASVASVETSFAPAQAAPTNLAYSQPNATYTIGQAITSNNPTSSGGKILSYSVTPELPSGFSFSTSTGRVTGTPSVLVSPAESFTVTALNSGGSTTATITILVNPAPPSVAYSAASFTLTKGTSYTLTATSTSAQSFSSGSLPAGLSLNSSTGAITGAPSEVSAAAPVAITVTAETGQTASTTLTLKVNDVPPSGLAYSSPSDTYVVGSAITENTPSSSGGAVVSYSITPNLASQTGLSFSTSTGVISGTPTLVKKPAGVYTVTARNTGGSTTATVTITVNAAAPTISYAGSPFTLTKGTGYTLTATTANMASVSLTGSLPAGMNFNSTTGAMTGAPSALKAATAYTVTALNSTGQTATATFSLTVNDIAPSSLVYSSSSATYTVGSAIAPMTVSSVGGGTVTSYSAALPSGLSINSSTGAISGTPSSGVAAPGSAFTITASNTGGSATATITITVLVPGCMNPQAVNYSSSATVDNGTCDLGPTDYPLVSACSGMCQGMRIVRATQSHEIGGSNYDETWNNLDGICSNYGFRAPTTSSSNGTLWDYNINSSAPLTSDQWNPTWPWMNGSLPNGFIGGRIWVAAGAPEWLSRAIYPSVSAGNSLYSNSGSIQWESYHPLSGGNNQYISSGTIAVGDFVLCGDQNSSMACPASMVESGGSCSNRMDCSQGGASYWYNGSSYADENSCLCASGLGGNCTVSCSDSQYDAGGYCANRMDCSSSGGYYWYNGNQYSDVGSCGSTMCSSQGSPYSHEGSCYGDAASYYAAYCSSMNAPYSSASGCHWDVSSYCSAVGGTVYNGECYSDLSSYCSAQGYDYSYNGQCYDLSGYCMATGYSYSYNGSCYDYAGYCSATGGMYYSGYCYTDVSSYCSASSGYYFDGTCYSDYSSYFQTSCSASGGYPYNNYCYGDHSSYCVAMGYAYGDGSSCYYSNPYSCSGYEYNGTCYSDHSSYCSAQGLSSNGSYCYCSGYDYNGTCYSDHSGYCGAQGMSSDGMNCY